VHLCCLRADQEDARQAARALYDEMNAQHIEVIMDDRTVSVGVMFSDADLLGIPIRAIVSPRNLKEGVCEIVTRDKSVSVKVPLSDVIPTVRKMIDEMM
jgi:prolyl-tRNA synthetase